MSTLENDLRTIAVYEESIGRPLSHRVAVSDGEGRLFPNEALCAVGNIERTVRAYAKRCSGYLRYGLELEACLNGELPPRNMVLMRGSTPEIYRKLGFSDFPMFQTQRHAKNEVAPRSRRNPSAHGLSIEVAKAIPEALERPVAVFEDYEGRGAVAMLDLLDDQRNPVIVPIGAMGTAATHGQVGRTNMILSVYGKARAAQFVHKQGVEGTVLYMDQKRASRLMASAGRKLPASCKGYEGFVKPSPSACVAAMRLRASERTQQKRDEARGKTARPEPPSLAEAIAKRKSAARSVGGAGRRAQTPAKAEDRSQAQRRRDGIGKAQQGRAQGKREGASGQKGRAAPPSRQAPQRRKPPGVPKAGAKSPEEERRYVRQSRAPAQSAKPGHASRNKAR